MSKGTPSKGKQSGKDTHLRCRRCGKHSYHMRKKRCSSCGFGKTARMRFYNWLDERKKPR